MPNIVSFAMAPDGLVRVVMSLVYIQKLDDKKVINDHINPA